MLSILVSTRPSSLLLILCDLAEGVRCLISEAAFALAGLTRRPSGRLIYWSIINKISQEESAVTIVTVSHVRVLI